MSLMVCSVLVSLTVSGITDVWCLKSVVWCLVSGWIRVKGRGGGLMAREQMKESQGAKSPRESVSVCVCVSGMGEGGEELVGV